MCILAKQHPKGKEVGKGRWENNTPPLGSRNTGQVEAQAEGTDRRGGERLFGTNALRPVLWAC